MDRYRAGVPTSTKVIVKIIAARFAEMCCGTESRREGRPCERVGCAWRRGKRDFDVHGRFRLSEESTDAC